MPYCQVVWHSRIDPLSGAPTRGTGSLAADAAGAAALLVADVARRTSGSWPAATATAAQLTALADRCTSLAERDAEVFAAALSSLEDPGPDLVERMDAAAAVPLEIAETAADVAAAAVLVAERCDGTLRADAAGAAALAAGAALAAAHLVRANLTVTEGDPRLARALRAAEDARDSATRALDAGA